MPRITPAKELLGKFLSTVAFPVSAQDCMSECLKHGLKPNKSTIYRELTSLLKFGIVRETIMEDGIKRYELAERSHGHCLVCESCGKVKRVELPNDLAEQERKIQQKTKFRIIRHDLTFYGRCFTCKNS